MFRIFTIPFIAFIILTLPSCTKLSNGVDDLKARCGELPDTSFFKAPLQWITIEAPASVRAEAIVGSELSMDLMSNLVRSSEDLPKSTSGKCIGLPVVDQDDSTDNRFIVVRYRDETQHLAGFMRRQNINQTSKIVLEAIDQEELSITCPGKSEIYITNTADSIILGSNLAQIYDKRDRLYVLSIESEKSENSYQILEGLRDFDGRLALPPGRENGQFAFKISWQNLLRASGKKSITCNVIFDSVAPSNEILVDDQETSSLVDAYIKAQPAQSIRISSSDENEVKNFLCLQRIVNFERQESDNQSCENFIEVDDVFAAPDDGAWLMVSYSVDSAGNQSAPTKRMLVVYDEKKLATISSSLKQAREYLVSGLQKEASIEWIKSYNGYKSLATTEERKKIQSNLSFLGSELHLKQALKSEAGEGGTFKGSLLNNGNILLLDRKSSRFQIAIGELTAEGVDVRLLFKTELTKLESLSSDGRYYFVSEEGTNRHILIDVIDESVEYFEYDRFETSKLNSGSILSNVVENGRKIIVLECESAVFKGCFLNLVAVESGKTLDSLPFQVTSNSGWRQGFNWVSGPNEMIFLDDASEKTTKIKMFKVSGDRLVKHSVDLGVPNVRMISNLMHLPEDNLIILNYNIDGVRKIRAIDFTNLSSEVFNLDDIDSENVLIRASNDKSIFAYNRENFSVRQLFGGRFKANIEPIFNKKSVTKKDELKEIVRLDEQKLLFIYESFWSVLTQDGSVVASGRAGDLSISSKGVAEFYAYDVGLELILFKSPNGWHEIYDFSGKVVDRFFDGSSVNAFFSGDGKGVFLQGRSYSLSYYSFDSKALDAVLDIKLGNTFQGLSNDSRYFWISSELQNDSGSKLDLKKIYDLETERFIDSDELTREMSSTNNSFPVGSSGFIYNEFSTVFRYDLVDGELLNTWTKDFTRDGTNRIYLLAQSKMADLIAMAPQQNELIVLNYKTGETLFHDVADFNYVDRNQLTSAFDPSGRFLLVSSEDTRNLDLLTLIDLQSKSVKRLKVQGEVQFEVQTISFWKTMRRATLTSHFGQVLVLDFENPETPFFDQFENSSETMISALTTSNDENLVVVDEVGSIRYHDPKDKSYVELATKELYTVVVQDKSGEYFLAPSYGGNISAFTKDGKILPKISLDRSIVLLDFINDEKQLLVGYAGLGISIIDWDPDLQYKSICRQMEGYLKYSPKVKEEDRALCQ